VSNAPTAIFAIDTPSQTAREPVMVDANDPLR
jgi:hypothetical protein